MLFTYLSKLLQVLMGEQKCLFTKFFGAASRVDSVESEHIYNS